ncbi:MAG TPA: 2-C-methyl-D-erythritol 2,4-cyclodiphosphate synthase [Dehalococcoidia bacterium]|jgi:2-C-methyl-D-erythritol 2,4-cyclodiphosphate synthase|nr:2-C-methyl-D-erythritol 2,4-cyclodiphosphate synthase [Dehalococcoidia bacterium]
MRVGQGFDAHRFAEGRKLMLGGVDVPYERGLAGHSDGDALLHAIVDALLGAAGMGDIGGMFPGDDERWKDANSLDLLTMASMRVRQAGYRIANVDATVIAEAPKVAPHVMGMRQAISTALQIDITNVSVKATTTDGMGFTGRGEGVAASAIVLLE